MNTEARDMIDCIFQLRLYALYLIAIENTVKASEIGYRLNYIYSQFKNIYANY